MKSFLAARHHVKKKIYFLTNIHTIEEVLSRKRNKEWRPIKILVLVRYYNKNIVGTDNNHAMAGTYSGVRKSYR